MACYKPIEGWRRADGAVTFSLKKALHSAARATVSCGRCIGCRLAKSASWGARILAELQSWPSDSSFCTFTYDDEHLPNGGSLVPRHMTLFLKRLRKSLGTQPLRYFYAGEYGGKTKRPHYHAILFGYMPDDLVVYKQTSFGPIWSSRSLDSLWTLGSVKVAQVMFESAAYVASYTLDKLHGDKAEAVYGAGWHPEFCRMSRRPGLGIGAAFDSYRASQMLDSDQVGIGPGRHVPVPRYFLEVLRNFDLDGYLRLKARRKFAGANSPENTPERLHAREQVTLARVSRYHREFEV